MNDMTSFLIDVALIFGAFVAGAVLVDLFPDLFQGEPEGGEDE